MSWIMAGTSNTAVLSVGVRSNPVRPVSAIGTGRCWISLPPVAADLSTAASSSWHILFTCISNYRYKATPASYCTTRALNTPHPCIDRVPTPVLWPLCLVFLDVENKHERARQRAREQGRKREREREGRRGGGGGEGNESERNLRNKLRKTRESKTKPAIQNPFAYCNFLW